MRDDDASTRERAPGAESSPPAGPRRRVLTINGGSSSLKFALFTSGDPIRKGLSGRIERVGTADARLLLRDADGHRSGDRAVSASDQAAAAAIVIGLMEREVGLAAIGAVGHRVVHGGGRFVEPGLVTAEMLDGLRRLAPLDPEHLPGEISLIEAFAAALPAVTQVACFDTAFHSGMPGVARVVPIPRRYQALGIRRYGFHGLSYAYLMEELGREEPGLAQGRVILAHLGAGASMAAVLGGRSIDTTMGFTPASGLVMGTRSGDLDPGLISFLADAEGMTPARFHEMANRQSGLLGVSETSADIRDLMAARTVDTRAAEAIDLFCYRVKANIGSLAAALGGLDCLVFSGGIGENSPEIRREACHGLAFLGMTLDEDRNRQGASVISGDDSRVRVRVIRTDEETMIARETIRLGIPSD